MSAGRERVKALITAKPLKMKALGRLHKPENPSKCNPGLIRDKSELNPGLIRDTSKENYVEKSKRTLHGKVMQVIYMLVRDKPAMRAGEITVYLQSFCHYQNYIERPDVNSVTVYLKKLVDEGKLSRIKVDGVYRYVRRLNNDDVSS